MDKYIHIYVIEYTWHVVEKVAEKKCNDLIAGVHFQGRVPTDLRPSEVLMKHVFLNVAV